MHPHGAPKCSDSFTRTVGYVQKKQNHFILIKKRPIMVGMETKKNWLLFSTITMQAVTEFICLTHSTKQQTQN